MVLPLTSKTSPEGHLTIGGCDTVSLAKKYGTPLFVIDEEHVRKQCRRYKKAFRDLDERCEIIYAGKAFLSVAFLKVIMEEGLSLDVMSGGELFVGMKAGFPAGKMYFHGNNKTPEELELALGVDLGRFVVDSEIELERLDRMAGAVGKKVSILIRLTPGIHATTHDYIKTGTEDTKFGFSIASGAALDITGKATEKANIKFMGYHAHIGSQILSLDAYEETVEVLTDFIKQVEDELGCDVKELDVGGGLGIKYKSTDEPSGIEDFAGVIVGGIKRQAERHGIKTPKIMTEPGRSIVGSAGVTLYTIGTIKTVSESRTYVSVDGGMSDNLRPMLYGATYETLIANKADKGATKTVSVAGKHCESGDILVEDIKIPEPETGDILVTPATGAYGYVMANNYNRQPRPAVIMVKDGSARVILRRETYEDLLRLEEY